MTAYTRLTIGDTLPPAPRPRGIVSGPEFPRPIWFALRVGIQKERATREYLRARDIFAFYPSHDAKRVIRGKASTVERPEIPGIVYAQFRQQPQWDILKLRDRLITGVFCRDGLPVEIHTDVIRHLQGLTVEAERLRQARAEMLRVRPGDRATITAGPLAGFAVDVTEVKGGIAWFQFITGRRGAADLASLERLTTSD